MIDTSGSSHATATFPFHDRRPPHAVQWWLEGDLMTLFTERPNTERYTLDARQPYGRQSFAFTLVYESASWLTNAYTLAVTLTDPGPEPETASQLAQRLASWMDLWTREFSRHDVLAMVGPSIETYHQRVQEARRAEADLMDVGTIQQEILRRLQAGEEFRTAHKEGGSRITWRDGVGHRRDYGEWSSHETFHFEWTFLRFLRTFFDGEVRRHVAPASIPDDVAWRLILRLLKSP